MKKVLKYIKLYESNEQYNVSNFNGTNLIFDRNGYKLFVVGSFEEIEGFASDLVMCEEKKFFDLFNKYGYIIFVFKDDYYYLNFRISRGREEEIDEYNAIEKDPYDEENDYKDNDSSKNPIFGIIYRGSSTSDYDDDMRFLHRMETNDPYLLKIILSVQKSYDLSGVMKKINENNDVSDLDKFNGTNLIIDTNGYKLFLSDSHEDFVGFDVCELSDKSFFETSNKDSYIYTVFKNDEFYLTFRIFREGKEYPPYDKGSIFDIVRKGTDSYKDPTNISIDHECFEQIKKEDPILHKLMLSAVRSYRLDDVYRKMNENNFIKEFWEWSKNSYGQDKSNIDAQTTITNFNDQHGYAEEGQWVKTQDGDVFIEELTNGKYIGFDRDGKPKEGSIKDIIRTLIKPEVKD
tara:strand:- start:28251 stop:29462 length:1212 start_codon:yes stop_codon:yes gene_type:complete